MNQNNKKELKVGDKVRWKQMPASIAEIVAVLGFESYRIKFSTDGPLKGTIVPATRAALFEVTILDEIAIEGSETPDPFFRKKKAEETVFEAEARRSIEEERRLKGL
jgi:hypothetical protein